MNYDAYKNTLPYKADREAYRTRQRELDAFFKADALAEAGLTNHPKADKAWAMAWDRGHASGYQDVMSELEDLAELLLD